MIKFIDFVTDLSYGDSGKGAVVYELAKKHQYDIVMRVNGGGNAGHTIYHEGKKFVTHIIPTGIFHGKTCIIGSECVINVQKFFDEIQMLKDAGIDTHNKIFISRECHVVTPEHIGEELTESKIGTTKQGIGPCIRDKYARKGIRAEQVKELSSYVIDLYDYFYCGRNESLGILCEGAQGHFLDISQGDYPFVTSSHCTVAGALLNSLPWNKIRKVYGVTKAYDTYVGARQFEPDEQQFKNLRLLGNEFGATTGRPRQCNWLNLSRLIKAMEINCVTHLIISKVDVLKKLNELNDNLFWCVNQGLNNALPIYLNSEEEWKNYIQNQLNRYSDAYYQAHEKYDSESDIVWRYSPTDKVEHE
jgi:adenylosuccinate synthase